MYSNNTDNMPYIGQLHVLAYGVSVKKIISLLIDDQSIVDFIRIPIIDCEIAQIPTTTQKCKSTTRHCSNILPWWQKTSCFT